MRKKARIEKQLELPSGNRFEPTDEELIMDYLTNKVLQKPILDVPIADLDITELFQQPPKLVVSYSTKNAEVRHQREWFFYVCSEDFLLCDDANAIQMVSNEQGFWKHIYQYRLDVDGDYVDSDDDYDDDTDIIGHKTEAVYFRGNLRRPKKTHWNMEIYELKNDFYDNLEEKKKTVLVKIRRGKCSSD